MDLEAQGLPPELAHVPKALTDAVAAAGDASHCDVVTRQDIASLADFEADRMACGASDSCLGEIGNALGVERLVAGSIVRVGATTTVSVRLLNLTSGAVEERAEESTVVDDHLRASAQRVARRLFASSPASSLQGPFFVVGGTVATVGVIVAVIGGIVVGAADGIAGARGTSGPEKQQALVDGGNGLVVVGIGAAVAVAGAAVVGVGFLVE